ncbi:MAG: hypothetical protein EHM12_00990 [Dehalococcoidia bacterium]|nr:MAG: hypothetical protein EHM12_00990 [Dehalococcoidia bacterium]
MIQIIETSQAVSHDPKVLNLIREMMDGRIEEIRPTIDFNRESGAVYPQVEAMLGKGTDEVIRILNKLVEENILEARFYDRLIFCPACHSMNLRPCLKCPKCGSGNVSKGRIIEHFACGKNGLEDEFLSNGKYVCPHCRKPLKFLGTDYRSLGVNYRCRSCGGLSTEITIKWQCLKCASIFADEESVVQVINSYVLNEQSRNLLTFDTGYKARYISFLKRQGYDVFEKAKVGGKSGSGVTHVLDMLAKRDDGFLTFILGIGVAIGHENEDIGLEDVFRFDNKVYDLGIHDKVLLAVPGLNNEARQFAQRQRIKSFNARELEDFLTKSDEIAAHPVKTVLFTFTNRSQLMQYLHDQGYRTEEAARIRGRSGAEYVMDIIAYFDDGLFTHTISIGILTDPKEVGLEAVSAYDTKAYDIGIHDKVLLVSPTLSKEARQFADQQRIRIIDVGDPSLI